ncbi:uncharacterized protein ZBIST_0669 [Zygosaccharomyces bailii]|nr:uncharacterized protein ZBIST_0669 [Zygosaccharomyces bailii]
MQLSVIDISEPEDQILQPLLDAAANQGFLLVDGHNFTQKEVDELYAISEEFFTTTPHEEKMKYTIDSRNVGYTDFNNENLDARKGRDYKEAYNFCQINFVTGALNQNFNRSKNKFEPASTDCMPAYFKKREIVVQNIVKKLHANAREIMRLLSLAMGVEDARFFVDQFDPEKPSPATFRLLHYPLIRNDNKAIQGDPNIRAGAHTDYGALTLLFQRQGEQGLQLLLDGENWMDVDFVATTHQGFAPPLVVNFGDLLSYWTNGILKSTIHRVKFCPGETRNSDRYSIVFFVDPENTTKLLPVPSKLVREKQTREKEPIITSLEHLQKRLAETYENMPDSVTA